MRNTLLGGRKGWFTLLVILLSGCASGFSAASASRLVVSEQSMGQVPTAETSLSVWCAGASGCRFAAVMKRPGGFQVFLDGQYGPFHDDIGMPEFSLDGKRLAYAARKNGRGFVVVDDRAGPEYDEIGTVMFSPDGNRLAYTARKGLKWFVVVDGQAGPQYDQIEWGTLCFSPDSKRVAYVARIGEKKSMVVDGRAGTAFEHITEPIFSADSRRIAYGARTIDDYGLWWTVVVDGVPGPPYAEVNANRLVFSPDGQHIAYGARKGINEFVVVDGQPGPGHEKIDHESPVYSPDGKHFAYAAKKNGKWLVLTDGRAGSEYDGAGGPTFSPDSKRLAYWAEMGNKMFVVADGRPGPGFDQVFSAYIPADGTASSFFSPDSKHLVYGSEVGKPIRYALVVDHNIVLEAEAPCWQLTFSPEGRHMAYNRVLKSGMSVVFVDGQTGPMYDEIGAGPVFRPDGWVEVIATRSKTLYRVALRPPDVDSQDQKP